MNLYGTLLYFSISPVELIGALVTEKDNKKENVQMGDWAYEVWPTINIGRPVIL